MKGYAAMHFWQSWIVHRADDTQQIHNHVCMALDWALEICITGRSYREMITTVEYNTEVSFI